MPEWISFPVGIIIASIATTFGIGGGVLWMPFLLLIMNLSPSQAVFTSLLIQCVGIGTGSVNYLRKKLVRFNIALPFLIATIPGLFFGSYINKFISKEQTQFFLGLIFIFLSIIFVLSKEEYLGGRENLEKKEIMKYLWIPFITSTISGAFSIGIGDFIIPVLNGKLKLKMRYTVATSIFIMSIVVVITSIIFFIFGAKPNIKIFLFAAPGVLIGGNLGPLISEKLSDQRLKELFIFILLLIGTHIIIDVV